MRDAAIDREQLVKELKVLRKRVEELEGIEAECKQAGAELARSRQLHARAEQIGNLGHWERDFIQDTSFWSEGMYSIFGVKPDEPRNSYEYFLGLVDPSDRELVKSSVKAAVSSRQKLDVEYRIIRPNGERRVVHSVAEARFDEWGQAVRLFGICQDITERRNAELALAEEAVRRRILIEQSRDGIVILDQNGKVCESNRHFAEMIGYSVDEVHQLHVWDWDTQWPREHLLEMIRRVDAQGDHFETRHRRRDGTVYDVEISTNGAVLGGQKLVFCVCRDISERKRSEEALRIGEKRYRTLIEKAPIAIGVSRDGEMLFANPRYMTLFGCGSNAQVIGMPITDRVAPQCRDEILEKNRRRERGETVPNSYETLGLHQDGSVFPLRLDVTLIDWEGHPSTFCFLSDISRQKEMEKALRESEERFRLLYEEAPIAYQCLDQEGFFLEVNEAWLRLLGYSKQDVIGRWFGDFLVSAHADELRKSLSKYISFGEISGVEFQMLRRDATRITVECSGKVSHDRDGRFMQIHCVLRDVTQQRLAEEALKESERRYRNLFEDAPIAIWEEDFTELMEYLEGLKNSGISDFRSYFESYPDEVIRCASLAKLISVNKATLNLYEAESISDFSDGLKSISCSESFKAFREVILGLMEGKTRFEFENVHQTLKGNKMFVILKLLLSCCEGGSGSKALISVIDTTERKRLEDQLRHVQKMESIGTLAGGIAHDFNNILASIIGYTELAIQDLPGSGSVSDDLHQVLQASYRARDLVKQVLSFSRKVGAQERSPMDIVPLIKETVKFLRASIPTTVEIRESIPSRPMVMMADPTQIHQVLINLCTNAAQAMETTGGMLGIGLTDFTLDEEAALAYPELKPGRYVRLSVSDTGHGMDKATMDRIFDPYFTTKGVGKGSGIGLAVVHGVVRRHEGTIRVYSEVGKGAVFHVFIPRVDAGPQPAVKGDGRPTGGNERILFVDDEEMLLQMGMKLLEQLGYRVAAVSSGLEALSLFGENPDQFDLIITDYTMPNLTGEQLARECLKIRPDIPILLCTGFNRQIDERKAREIGIREFVMKPLSLRSFGEAIRRAITPSDQR